MDRDPGGPKTYGSDGSGFGYATLPQSVKFLTESVTTFFTKMYFVDLSQTLDSFWNYQSSCVNVFKLLLHCFDRNIFTSSLSVPDPESGNGSKLFGKSGSGSESRILMTKNPKILQFKTKFKFFDLQRLLNNSRRLQAPEENIRHIKTCHCFTSLFFCTCLFCFWIRPGPQAR
jgi:hypothetical protein